MHILNTITETGAPAWIPIPISILIITLITLIAIGGEEHPFLTVAGFITVFICVILAIYGFIWGMETRVYHDVAFHDPVDMDDFLDKYEIIKVEGHIIRIKEKGSK